MLGQIWVTVSDSGGETVIVNPRTLEVVERLDCCPPEGYEDGVAIGRSIWTYDTPTGTVERWNAQTYQGMFNTHVTDPPFYDGQCLNAIAADARAVWVTAMASTNYECL